MKWSQHDSVLAIKTPRDFKCYVVYYVPCLCGCKRDARDLQRCLVSCNGDTRTGAWDSLVMWMSAPRLSGCPLVVDMDRELYSDCQRPLGRRSRRQAWFVWGSREGFDMHMTYYVRPPATQWSPAGFAQSPWSARRRVDTVRLKANAGCEGCVSWSAELNG